MEITLDQIKELRKATGAGVSNVKEALENSKGDMEKAIEYLREKGIAKAAKRADKQADNGFVAHYIHGEGSIGVLLELNSETDFTARNETFRSLAHDIALHIAASRPEYATREDVPADIIEKESEIAKQGTEGKPDNVVEKIVEGRLSKFYEEVVLLDQKFVKDDSKTIGDLINDAVAAIGEKIEVGRFARIEIAGGSSACGL